MESRLAGVSFDGTHLACGAARGVRPKIKMRVAAVFRLNLNSAAGWATLPSPFFFNGAREGPLLELMLAFRR